MNHRNKVGDFRCRARRSSPALIGVLLIGVLALTALPVSANFTIDIKSLYKQLGMFGTYSLGGFRDEFSKPLDMVSDWEWLDNSHTSHASVTSSGFYRVKIASSSGLLGPSNIPVNLLLTQDTIPNDESFVVETMVLFKPEANFQNAGIIVYESKSEFLMLGRAFAYVVDEATGKPIEGMIGDGLYFDCEQTDQAIGSNYATEIKTGAQGAFPLWLRIERRGSVYTGWYSLNHMSWHEVGKHTAAFLSNVKVGLAVWNSNQTNLGPAASFDYFELKRYFTVGIYDWLKSLTIPKEVLEQISLPGGPPPFPWWECPPNELPGEAIPGPTPLPQLDVEWLPVELTNAGREAEPETTLAIYFNAELLAVEELPLLMPGDSWTVPVQLPREIPPGAYTLSLVVGGTGDLVRDAELDWVLSFELEVESQTSPPLEERE